MKNKNPQHTDSHYEPNSLHLSIQIHIDCTVHTASYTT